MRLALVVVEEHTGRAVHLADDDPLGAVDDEGAVVGHQRHVAHIDGLLLDIADRARAGVFIDVPDDQAQNYLERSCIGHAPLDAFLDVVFRVFQLVIDELQPPAAGEIIDRKHRPEHLLQPGVGAAVGTHVHLQERLVAGALHIDQVGHRRHFGNAPKIAANALMPRDRPGNCVHRLSCSPWLLGGTRHPWRPIPFCPVAAKRKRGRERPCSRPCQPCGLPYIIRSRRPAKSPSRTALFYCSRLSPLT